MEHPEGANGVAPGSVELQSLRDALARSRQAVSDNRER
jgi:hypothetical protein